jgi:hypothetical protein
MVHPLRPTTVGKKRRIGLTPQGPRMYCRCDPPQAAYNMSDSRWAVRICLRCKLVVWR